MKGMMKGFRRRGENIWPLVSVILPPIQVRGASILQRSIEMHSMLYKCMVSDGDSRTFKTIENLYKGCKVTKLDLLD